MYQVLQVYTSFSLIDNFLLRSIKVGQALSQRHLLRVVETWPKSCKMSPQSHGDVFATFPQSPSSPAGLGYVAQRSPLLTTNLVAATSLRCLRDLLET